MHPVAARRILRVAFGTSVSLLVSQILNLPFSYIMPLLTMVILSAPLPAPGIKMGVGFVVAMVAPMLAGAALLPFLYHARWSGICLLTVALFYSFYFTSRGGSPILGTFITIGLTLVVTIGSVNMDFLLVLINALAVYAFGGMLFVWLAHGVLPDLPRKGPPPPKPKPPVINPDHARLHALRSLLVVLPVALVFLFLSASPAYTVVMIKVASMGQQANTRDSRAMGRELLLSTLLGGVLAMAAWQVLSLWPSLLFYCLIVSITVLILGRWVFQGPGMHPRASLVSYAMITFLIILAPSVLDSPTSSSADSAFYSRIFLLLIVAVYGTIAVTVFDAFWPTRPAPKPLAQHHVPDPGVA